MGLVLLSSRTSEASSNTYDLISISDVRVRTTQDVLENCDGTVFQLRGDKVREVRRSGKVGIRSRWKIIGRRRRRRRRRCMR